MSSKPVQPNPIPSSYILYITLVWSKYEQHSVKLYEALKNNTNVRTLCIDNKKIRERIVKSSNVKVNFAPTMLAVFNNGKINKYEKLKDIYELAQLLLNKEQAKEANYSPPPPPPSPPQYNPLFQTQPYQQPPPQPYQQPPQPYQQPRPRARGNNGGFPTSALSSRDEQENEEEEDYVSSRPVDDEDEEPDYGSLSGVKSRGGGDFSQFYAGDRSDDHFPPPPDKVKKVKGKGPQAPVEPKRKPKVSNKVNIASIMASAKSEQEERSPPPKQWGLPKKPAQTVKKQDKNKLMTQMRRSKDEQANESEEEEEEEQEDEAEEEDENKDNVMEHFESLPPKQKAALMRKMSEKDSGYTGDDIEQQAQNKPPSTTAPRIKPVLSSKLKSVLSASKGKSSKK